jgi:hypothetical protein
VCLFLSSDLANYTFSLTSLGRRQRLCYIVGIYGVEEQRTDPDNGIDVTASRLCSLVNHHTLNVTSK